MPHRIYNQKFGDLLVIEQSPKQLNRSRNRFWLCKCLRSVHGDATVTRYVTAHYLLDGSTVACVTCSKSDRAGQPRKWKDAPVARAQAILAAPRGCAQLLCRPPFHAVDCTQLALFPISRYTHQVDTGESR